MTPEKKAQIEELAEIACKAGLKVKALNMVNMYGRTVPETVAMAKEFAIADAEWLEATANLKAAQQP